MYMTLCMDIILCVIFVYTGYWEARRVLARQPRITLENALEQAHYLFILIPLSLIPMCLSLLLKGRRSILWHMPLWLQYNLTSINWGIILSIVIFLFALASGLALHTHHHKRWRIIGSLFIVVISIQISQFLSIRPIAAHLTENLINDGIILQTTGVTCCAASAANIARIFGIEKTEKEMAHLFGTTFQGTSVAQVVYGMRKLGFLCTMRDLHVPDPTLLRPPAMLFIDHPLTGPESHAVVYVGSLNGRAEIWDSVMGKRFFSENDLTFIWHCKAIEINIQAP
ncbi:MAG: cysteine peptidase family C39 domain-containing protein [bacterium]